MTQDLPPVPTPPHAPLPPLEEPKKNNSTLLIVAIVLVVLCCCCLALGGIYYLYQNGDRLFGTGALLLLNAL